jgi:hypothetical protein
MTADQFLFHILAREAVDTSVNSPLRQVAVTLMPSLRAWAGDLLVGVHPSGSFAKGTANASGTDIDLFLSLRSDTTATLNVIYDTLFTRLQQSGYTARKQNVSIGLNVGTYKVDLVPAKQQQAGSSDHSLWRNRAQTWTKTNIGMHIATVQRSGRQNEIRIIKLWRNQRGFDFPSFYLELSVIAALNGNTQSGFADRIWSVLTYLANRFENARAVDPANTNNVISDDISTAAKKTITNAASETLKAKTWGEVVK